MSKTTATAQRGTSEGTVAIGLHARPYIAMIAVDASQLARHAVMRDSIAR
jgi:hypothetical protein